MLFGNHRVYLALLVTLMAPSFGCGTLEELDPAWRSVEKRNGAAATYGEGVRLALADVQDEVPPANYRDLLSQGTIRESSAGASVKLSGELRKGLLASVNGRVDRLGDGVVQVYSYEIDGRLPRMKIELGGFSTQIPFQITGGAKVEIARIFRTQSAANRAEPIGFLDIPYDRDSALALPPNTVVSVPIDGKISFSAGGNFLSKSASFSRTFQQHLTTSAYGSYSGVRQGTLVGEGTYRLQFIRLDGNRIRVRALSASRYQGSGSISVSAFASARYIFTPASVLERARSIRRQLEKAGRELDKLRALPRRIDLLRGRLEDPLERLVDKYPGLSESGHHDPVRADALRTQDPAIGLAHAASAGLEQFNDTILTKVEAQLDRATTAWDERVDPTLDRIRRLSSHALNVSASARLSGEFARRLRTVADFEYDLSDPEAALAFERAVSGRTIWQGAVGTLQDYRVQDGGLADFTLSDTLATEQAGNQHRTVQRHALASGDFRESQLRLSFDGLWMRSGFGWRDRQNKVRLVDDSGYETTWLARAWEFRRDVKTLVGSDSESVGSGAFSRHGTDDVLDGGYWFGWQRDFPSYTAAPVATSIGMTLNTLGPIGLKLGVQTLYQGEHRGTVKTDLAVLFNGDALTALFDHRRTPDELLWKVLADTAATFDNKFVLPYLARPWGPRGLDEIEGGSEACDTVAHHLGGFYCHYFANKFIPALRAAQADFAPEQRLDFFETFYKAGPFGSGAGSRFFVRYIAAVVHELGEDDGVSVRLDIRNRRNPSEAASPSLAIGMPLDLTLLESTAPIGMR